MKQYLQKTLKDTFLTWLILEIGIVISAILYAIMKVGGASGNMSLLVAFIVLVGLIVLGLAFFSTNTSRLRQLLGRWLLGEPKPSLQLESLVVRQNILLEKLNQNLNSIAISSAIKSPLHLAPEQSPKELIFQLSSDSLTKLDELVDAIDSNVHDSIVEQRNLAAQLAQNQQREQVVIEQLGNNVADQQASLTHVVENLTAQQRIIEQLVQILEQQNANKEEIGVKAAILGPEGREISYFEVPQAQVQAYHVSATDEGIHIGTASHIREGRSVYLWTPDTKPFTESEQTEQQQEYKEM